jgi:hypothetical protein
MAMLGVAAVAVGLTAYLKWPGRQPAATRQQRALIAYLLDHLAGADAAIQIAKHLDSRYTGTEHGMLFARLSREFDEDRSAVHTLLTELGGSGASIKRAAGFASGHMLSVIAGGERGELSLLLTLEALAIGVQGKRCLWRTLQSLPTVSSRVGGPNFDELEARAVRQWEAIEGHRRALAVETFSSVDFPAEEL